jgi:3D (Asp-Asp-Asp) domain-containing protein
MHATRSRIPLRLVLACVVVVGGCARQVAVRPPAPALPPPPPESSRRDILVTASAFNSSAEQTDAQPHVTASGERLRPGMRAIAVSRDLERAGLTFGTRVQIDGLNGEWVVLDRMASRWRRKIDVYMGNDEAAARRFGKRKVRIRWTPK